MIPKSGDRAGLDASGVATAEFSSGNARDTPLRVGSYRKMARECSFHTVCQIGVQLVCLNGLGASHTDYMFFRCHFTATLLTRSITPLAIVFLVYLCFGGRLASLLS